jgi:Mycobacterial cell wall arabinan synthesis protein
VTLERDRSRTAPRALRVPARRPGRTDSPPRRVRLAQALAFLGLVAALVGALGPAEHVRTTYAWPPATLPGATPDRAWYAPLLLSRHRPDAVSVSIPCALPPPLPGAAAPVTVLATARNPRRAGGLALTRSGRRLTVRVGNRILVRVPLVDAGEGGSCSYRLRMEDRRWSLEGGPAGVSRQGVLNPMPVVFGLFSGLDLDEGRRPAIEVTTAVHAARTVARQAVAWTVSAIAILAAISLVAIARRPRPLAAIRRALTTGRDQMHPVDGLVGLGLVTWWILAPAFFDDGWIHAKLTSFESSGGFSSYYVFLGTNAPLGYWVDWPLHWLAESTNLVLFLRMPQLLCLGAVWILCRVVLARVLSSSTASRGVALWTLAAAFLVGVLAWGMTLRPEPMVALVVVAVLVCVVQFRERESAAPLALSAVLVPLAVTAHPSGVVALAPLLAAAPPIARFARRNIPATTALAVAAVGLSLVLLFLGADVDQRRVDTQTISALDTAADSWFDESSRYELLSVEPYGTPLRRALVALIALTLVAFALRLRRRSGSRLDLPAIALGIGLLLLVPTPSKWPSHFGTFIGLAAIAAATEMTALRERAPERRRRVVQPLALIAAGTVAIAWSWLERDPWNIVDLRTLDWRPAFESWLPLWIVASAVPLVLLVAALATGRPAAARLAPARAASWTAVALATPLIAFTVGILLADTLRTGTWTHARQTLETFTGRTDCGLAEDLVVTGSASSSRERFSQRLAAKGSRSLVLPSLLTYFPCARLPELRNGVVEAPNEIVTYPNPYSPIRYPLTSPFVGVLDLYRLVPLRYRADGGRPVIELYDVDRRIRGATLAPATQSMVSS